MGRKPNPPPDDPAQSKRFIDTAKETEADDEKALDRALASPRSSFPPIADYAFLSDCETTALIAPSGAVEWLLLAACRLTRRAHVDPSRTMTALS